MFSPKSLVAAMLYCQVSKTESLNSICDIAQANVTLWTSTGVAVPRRNTLSNANAVRPAAMAKYLYWKMRSYLTGIAPKFGRGPHKGPLAPRRPRARRPLEPPQAYRHAEALWDSRPHEISRQEAETPDFPARFRLRTCWNGTADTLKNLQNRETAASV